ncbi:MAG TPA: EAL domain-containing protein [Thermoanaerobaculia bacterium]|nr:EAL domain-containing protein [Thermoanaerobaculia bacterium]
MSVVVGASQDRVVADLVRRGFHSVVFQPIRRLDDGTIYGFEALMRGPTGTLLASPGRIFCRSSIDWTLLHKLDVACFFSSLRLGRLASVEQTLFINLHGETLLRYSNGADEVRRLLDQLAIAPSRIVIELSEMTERTHVRSIGRTLRPLRAAGVRLALDDIGARYPWLHHMLWLEPDFLKLDRSFVRGAARSSRRRNLIVGMVPFVRGCGAEIMPRVSRRQASATPFAMLESRSARGSSSAHPCRCRSGSRRMPRPWTGLGSRG